MVHIQLQEERATFIGAASMLRSLADHIYRQHSVLSWTSLYDAALVSPSGQLYIFIITGSCSNCNSMPVFSMTASTPAL
jgi:hypothetical protein